MSAKQKIKKKPLQVYLEPNQLDALRYQAELKGVSLAHLIRKSIDLFPKFASILKLQSMDIFFAY